jgi:hypothetical protein
MRLLSIAVLSALAIFGSLCSAAQQPEFTGPPASHRVTWSYDPLRHAMKAVVPPPMQVAGRLEAALASSSTTGPTTSTGTLELNIAVKFVSALPENPQLACSAVSGLEYTVKEQISATLLEVYDVFLESDEGVVAAVSGSTATCKFMIPYSWPLPASSSTTTVTVNGIFSSVTVDLTAQSTGGSTSQVVSRSTTLELTGPITLPSDGTTTVLSGNAVL